MAKITAIKEQAKNRNRLSIYIDDEYSFSLSIWQLGEHKLKIGDEIDLRTIEMMESESDIGKMLDRTLGWLTIRPRSEWEIDQYLSRKSIDEELREQIINQLKKKGYVDDADFSKRWIDNRRLLKSMSKYKIKQELIKKRVPREIIEQSIGEDDVDDIDSIMEIIRKRRHKYKDEQKLMGYLSRQGYSYGVIKQALEESD